MRLCEELAAFSSQGLISLSSPARFLTLNEKNAQHSFMSLMHKGREGSMHIGFFPQVCIVCISNIYNFFDLVLIASELN